MRPPTDGEALSSIEQDFFRAGDEMDANAVTEDVVDSDIVARPQRSAWSRWFARSSRPATDPAFAENENSEIAKI